MAVTDLAELLAPSRCLGCRARAPLPWCRRCHAEVRPIRGGCPRCGGARGVGHPCWPAGAPFATTTAVYDYRGPVAAAIVTAKLGGARRGWRPLAARLAAAVAATPPDVDAVTWVTTADRRRRARGVDHARVLAEAVAVGLGVPAVLTVAATDRGRAPDRFVARHRLPGTNLLVVDDVLTTGTTAVRVAAVLRAAGAGGLHLAVLARAGSHPLVEGVDAGGSRPRVAARQRSSGQ